MIDSEKSLAAGTHTAEHSRMQRSDFGADFIWGASTASYQIEGAWNEDGKGESIWDRFSHKRGKIARNENGDTACDHYHRYGEDIALMRSLNLRHYRLSLAWSRIFPGGIGKPNPAGVEYYHKVLAKCKENGVTPWVTLYHWDLPQALQENGGWANRDIIEQFSAYVDFCTKEFREVENWMILNEPVVFTGGGYFLGVHAPGERGVGKFIKAMHHTAMSQAEGGRIAKRNAPHAQVGTTISCTHTDPWNQQRRNLWAARRYDAAVNRIFVDAMTGRGYPVDAFPLLKRVEKYARPGDMEKLKFDFDFLGVQNYTRAVVKFSLWPPILWVKDIPAKKRGKEFTDMGWEVYPEGMYNVLKKWASYPEIKKIIVTESGCAVPDVLEGGSVHDERRITYHQKYLEQILKAKNEGANIQGYFAWSFMDNFEWAEGYRPRFGLVYVDYPTQRRVPKDSALWFQKFLG